MKKLILTLKTNTEGNTDSFIEKSCYFNNNTKEGANSLYRVTNILKKYNLLKLPIKQFFSVYNEELKFLFTEQYLEMDNDDFLTLEFYDLSPIYFEKEQFGYGNRRTLYTALPIFKLELLDVTDESMIINNGTITTKLEDDDSNIGDIQEVALHDIHNSCEILPNYENRDIIVVMETWLIKNENNYCIEVTTSDINKYLFDYNKYLITVENMYKVKLLESKELVVSLENKEN